MRWECLKTVRDELIHRMIALERQGAKYAIAERFAACAGYVPGAGLPPPLEQVTPDRGALFDRLVSYTSLVTDRPSFAAERAGRIADGLIAYLQRRKVQHVPHVPRNISQRQTDFSLRFRHAFTGYGLSPQHLQYGLGIDHKFPDQAVSLREWARHREKALCDIPHPSATQIAEAKPWHPDIDIMSRCLRLLPLQRTHRLPATPSGCELSAEYLGLYRDAATLRRVLYRIPSQNHLEGEMETEGQRRALTATLEMFARAVGIKNIAGLTERDTVACVAIERLLKSYGVQEGGKLTAQTLLRAIVRARKRVTIITSIEVEPRRRRISSIALGEEEEPDEGR